MIPLVIVNGWSMSRVVWEPLASALPQVRDIRYIDLDDSFPELAGGVEAAAQALARRAPARCDVIGWSLGAQLVLQWAAAAGGQLHKVGLIAATPRFVAGADWTAGMPKQVFDAFAQAAQAPDATLARFTLLQARGDARASTVARTLRTATGVVGEAARAAGLAILRDADLRPNAARVTQPVLLAHGAEDALVPVSAAEWLVRHLPHAQLHLFPATAHAPQVSQAAALATLLDGFFHGQ